MYPDEPQLAISRVLDARRELAFPAFTAPDHLATWWEALEKLGATLLHIPAAATDAEV
jgi:uncharacterized protein YndB with AHSA1/START domain